MDVTKLDVKCNSCSEIISPQHPKNRRKYGLLSAGLFALFFGVGLGGLIGLATAGFGMPATIPFGILGLYFGLKAGRWIAKKQDGITCPDCGHSFS